MTLNPQGDSPSVVLDYRARRGPDQTVPMWKQLLAGALGSTVGGAVVIAVALVNFYVVSGALHVDEDVLNTGAALIGIGLLYPLLRHVHRRHMLRGVVLGMLIGAPFGFLLAFGIAVADFLGWFNFGK